MNATHPLDRPGERSVIVAALKVSQQAISNWKAREVPIEHCLQIELATNGRITRKELRPNDFWKIWPDLPMDGAHEVSTGQQPAAQGV